MSSPDKENDPIQGHKYFAIKCNNRAWDLACKSRSKAEDQEMLNTAHASAFHWQAVGVELNNMRAKMLLAEVHALLGMGSTAFTLGTEMRDYFSEHETSDWEAALVHTIYAHAAFASGDISAHKIAYLDATKALEAISNPAERKIVQDTFDLVPTP